MPQTKADLLEHSALTLDIYPAVHLLKFEIIRQKVSCTLKHVQDIF